VAKKRKPIKRGKPLTARKKAQEGNRRMVDFFMNQLNGLRKGMGQLEQAVNKSMQELWNNQQLQNEGLAAFEGHVAILRRVLNDALGGTTRVTKVERPDEGDLETTVEAQVIDWAWYAEQSQFSDDRKQFIDGFILSEEEISERREKQVQQTRARKVMFLAGRAADADEEKLRKALEDGEQDEILKAHVPPEGVKWEDEMSEISKGIVEGILHKRDMVKAQQEKLSLHRERELLRETVRRAIAQGEEEEVFGDNPVEFLQGMLPNMVQWTETMTENVEKIIDEVRKEIEEKEAENDPEEVADAADKLLEETKKFGEDASAVIDLINEGKEEEAREAMAKLEQRVKEKEDDAAEQPPLPDGAAVFGGK